LVVAPSSAFGGWQKDLDLEGETSVTLLTARKKAKRVELLKEDSKWTLINKEGFLAVPEIAQVDWDAVILDESTFIKNPKAKVTRFFLKHFRDVPHRWILTGMPNPETDLNFWCQLAFLDGHFMKCRSYWDFRVRHYIPGAFNDWVPKITTADQVQKAVGMRCFIQRRKDTGMDRRVVTEVRQVELPPEIRKTYVGVENDYALNDELETKWSVTQYSWLRQLCGGFADGDYIWTGKMQELLSLLKGELAHEPVVVWFNYNNELHRAAKTLTENGIMNTVLFGGVPLEERERRRQAFQSGKVRVILLQQAVAQMGMDLSRADTAIYYSEPVSHLASRQTRDRIVNLNKNGQLLILYLLAENTVDEDVHELVNTKRLTSGLSLSKALQHAMRRRRSSDG